MNYPDITVGLGQMHVVWGDVTGNLERAAAMVKQAAQVGCTVLVLPECLDYGYAYPEVKDLAQPIGGQVYQQLAEMSRAHALYVIAGITERCGEHIYSAAALIDPQGELQLLHRKINELTPAHHIYSIGDRMGVVDTPFGTVGLTIGSDNFTSSLALGHALCRMGAHYIFSPSTWMVEASHDQQQNPFGASWRQSHRRLAYLYGITMASTSCVGSITAGPWKGRKAIGSSLAFAPGGEAVAQGPFGVDAVQLITFRAKAMARAVKGSAYAPYLKAKGYDGP
ncbi:MAG TPA: carbon-nitrogen hydrolase family protein [Firmicutes bacterium]|jgi:N-carbamoylputrescine amidase|nr:carbon-nitrogen hydrolase family protein [Bacillota bacterium]